MSLQSTGVTVTFSSSDAATILTIEDDSKGEAKPAEGVGWVAVWSGGRPVRLSSTSGNPVTQVNARVTRKDSSTCSFNKSNTTSLPHSNVSDVKMTSVGTFLTLQGAPLSSVNLTIDSATGVITASQPCYGSVAVSYTTEYQRYSCAFALDPNYDEEDPNSNKYAEMVVVVFCENDDASVTLTEATSGKKEGFDSSKSEPDNSSAGTKIQIELRTPTFISGPPQAVSNGYSCYAEIYVYVGSVTAGHSAMPVVSEGMIQDTVSTGPFEFVEIEGEQLFWAGQAVANTHYLPISNVHVTPISSDFVAKHESQVIIAFETQEGTLTQPKVYRDDGSGAYAPGPVRRTKYGDVIAMDSGLSVDVTGSATVKYTTNRKQYQIWWYRPEQVGGRSPWFRPLTVWVTAGEYSGSLVINPPPNIGNV